MPQSKAKFKKGDLVTCSGTGAKENKKYKITHIALIEGFWGPSYYYKLDGLPVMRSENKLSK